MSVPFLKMFWRHFCINTLSYSTTSYGHQNFEVLLEGGLGYIDQ